MKSPIQKDQNEKQNSKDKQRWLQRKYIFAKNNHYCDLEMRKTRMNIILALPLGLIALFLIYFGISVDL